MLKRDIDFYLEQWFNAKENELYNKPIILDGVRQVGKTTTVINFLKSKKVKYIYFDFRNVGNTNHDYLTLIKNKNLDEFIKLVMINNNISNQDKLFIFFDESQECIEIIELLKYFNQNYPEIKVIVSGSLLSLKMNFNNENIMYPVGKINYLNLNPLSFEEFLINVYPQIDVLIKDIIYNLKPFEISILNLIFEKFHEYLLVGGMPESVNLFMNEQKNKNSTLTVCKNYLNHLFLIYKNDITNHFKSEFEKVKAWTIMQEIDKQLLKENNRFIIADLSFQSKKNKNNRLRDFKVTLSKLVISRMVNYLFYLDELKIPLMQFKNSSKFKIYFCDIAFFTNLYNISTPLIAANSEVWTKVKGSVCENFVNNEIIKALNIIDDQNLQLFTYRTNNVEEKLEIDFIFDFQNFLPFITEVKSSKNIKSPSFQKIIKKLTNFNYLKLSYQNLAIKDKYIELPIFLIGYFIRYHLDVKNRSISKTIKTK